jgi:hypothetical protein
MLATAITLLLVPVLYAVFVLDLKWIKWGGAATAVPEPTSPEPASSLLRPQGAH